MGKRKHSVLPEPVPVATTVDRPTPAARRENAVRWWRYGVNPRGTSGNGSPPSVAGWNGRAMERYGPLARFSGWARKSSMTCANPGFDGPKPVARKSRRAPVTSAATTEGIIGSGPGRSRPSADHSPALSSSSKSGRADPMFGLPMIKGGSPSLAEKRLSGTSNVSSCSMGTSRFSAVAK